MSGKQLLIGALVLVCLIGGALCLKGNFQKPSQKVLLIGLDGAEWDMINPLIEKGELPNIASLKNGGAYGSLQSLELMLSPIIWTTIATGKDPEQHGITWFLVDSEKTGQRIPVTSTTRKCKAIWNILSENDRTVGAVGWWATYPAETVDGFIVSDHMAYHTFGVSGRTIKATFGKTHPKRLLEDIEHLVPEPASLPYDTVKRFIHVDEVAYDASADASETLNFMNPISHFRQIYSTVQAYRDIGTKLYAEQTPDLMAVYFEGVDSCEHLFMHCVPPKPEWTNEGEYARYMDVVTEMYKEADATVGEFLKLRDENTTVILVSDHGFEVGDERTQRKAGTELATAHLQHRRDGVLIVNGPDIEPGKEVFGGTVQDITPMVLHLLGLPVARDMAGTVLDDAFTKSFMDRNPVEYVDTYEGGYSPSQPGGEGDGDQLDESMDDAVVARLQALGYIGGGGESGGDSLDDGTPAEIDGNMARIKQGKGKLREAAEDYERSLLKKPEADATHFELSQIYVQLGEDEKALEHARTAVRLAPHVIGYRFGLASILSSRERYAQALEVYQAIINATPGNPDVYSSAGDTLIRMGDLPKAEAAFKKAIEIAPNHRDAWFNLGVWNEQQAKLKEAEECYRKVIEVAPNHYSANLNLGNTLDKLGDEEGALAAYDKSIELGPEQSFPYFNKALIESRQGKHKEARENLLQAIGLTPDIPPMHREFFLCNVRLGDNESAAKALDGWRRLEPASPEVWFQKARLHYSKEEHKSGHEAFVRCLQLGGRNYMQRGLRDPLLEGVATRIRAEAQASVQSATATVGAATAAATKSDAAIPPPKE